MSLAKRFSEANVRMTPQRALIMDVILSSNDHPDAEEIYIRARQKSDQASIATTYRTLTVLYEAGMIQKLHMQDGKARYEAQRADHNHLIDSESGKIHEFKDKRLDNLLKKIVLEMGYDVVNVKLDVEGKKRGDVECGCIQIKIY